jgi:hypothetical protein
LRYLINFEKSPFEGNPLKSGKEWHREDGEIMTKLWMKEN